MNSTGLPDAQHYSTAQDLYLLAAALIRDFPSEYAQYYSQKEFRYNNITQPNRNRLLWTRPERRRREDRPHRGRGLLPDRLVAPRRPAPALGAARLDLGSDARAGVAQAAQLGLPVLRQREALRRRRAGQGASRCGKARRAGEAGFGLDLFVTVPKGEADKLKAELISQQPLVAPLAKGQRVGMLRVTHDGKPFGEYPLVALEAVAQAGFFGRAWDTLRLWLK